MKHLIIGAGPVGITTAEELRKLDATASITGTGWRGRGAQLTILVRSGRMVSLMMPASEMIGRRCESKGVRILGKTQAALSR